MPNHLLSLYPRACTERDNVYTYRWLQARAYQGIARVDLYSIIENEWKGKLLEKLDACHAQQAHFVVYSHLLYCMVRL